MKILYVLRHAKSSWENLSQADFDRPLNERGLQAAPKMGEFMRGSGLIPDLIVASPAARAQATAQLVKDAGEFSAAIKFNQRIYEAAVSDLIEVINAVPDSTEKLLLVGHNPGLEGLVRILTGETREMPTAALAEISLNVETWENVEPDCGKLLNLFKPKEIAD